MVCGREEGLDVIAVADAGGDQLMRDHAEDHLESVGQGSKAGTREKHVQEASKALAKEGNGKQRILRSNSNSIYSHPLLAAGAKFAAFVV